MRTAMQLTFKTLLIIMSNQKPSENKCKNKYILTIVLL